MTHTQKQIQQKCIVKTCQTQLHEFFTISLSKTKPSNLTCNLHIHSTPWGPNQSLLSPYGQSLCSQPAATIKPINPSAEHDYDWSGCQTINLYPLHSLFWCGCTKYHEIVSTVVPAQWNNRVIRQSAFDLGGQLIHIPIYLNYFLWNGYRRKHEHFICSQMTIPFFFHLRIMSFYFTWCCFFFCQQTWHQWKD